MASIKRFALLPVFSIVGIAACIDPAPPDAVPTGTLQQSSILDSIASVLDDAACYAAYADPLYDQVLAGIHVAREAGAIDSQSSCDSYVADGKLVAQIGEVEVPSYFVDCACKSVFSDDGSSPPPPTWHAWASLGTSIVGRPGATHPSEWTIDVYAESPQGLVIQRYWDGAAWQPASWVAHNDGGLVSAAPSPISIGTSRDLYVRGLDGQAYHKSWDGAWHNYDLLGGPIADSPSAVAVDGGIDVFAREPDGTLIQKTWNGSGWLPSPSTWTRYSDGGLLSAAPTAVAWSGARAVFGRGMDGAVWLRRWSPAGWAAWEPLGGVIPAGDEVGVASPAPGQLDVYIRGMDNHLYQKYFDGQTWHPSKLGWVEHQDGMLLGSAPSVLATATTRHVFARGQDGTVIYKAWYPDF
jgi:hypothetical protein